MANDEAKNLKNDSLLGHYRIVKKLGAGGMGEVFLAADTKLDRRVALKILPSEYARDEERMRRFVREAKSASTLNHPNIITIYEIGEADAVHYMAVEYIEGQTLREKLKGEPLNLKSALEIAIQMASALDAAHRAGIVHRDVKPENVMIRPDSLVKLLDFGIAKLTEKQPSTEIDSEAATAVKVQTSPGRIVGTAAYMSPEQARGKETDARTDIFSFGVVLYEMLAGEVPFEGENAIDVIGSILHKEPKPLNRAAPDTPRELQHIVQKSLRKDRDERYQTAKDLLIDLRDVKQELEFLDKLERGDEAVKTPRMQSLDGAQTDTPRAASSAEYVFGEIKRRRLGAVIVLAVSLATLAGLGYWFLGNPPANTRQIESIAVLPFVNDSGSADVEYLSDGMTETLIGSLSKLPNLNVKARSSVFRYKGKETPPEKIGQELNVQAILTGRVTQRGNDLSLYIELVDPMTEKAIWSETYNRTMANLISLQSEIARDVADRLKAKLSGADEQKLTKNYTENYEAYQQYLLGRFYWNKRSKDGLYRAINHYSQAVRVDPNYAIAYSGLADAYIILQGYDKSSAALDSQMKAREYALKALSLDDTLSEAHVSNAVILQTVDFKFEEAELEYKRALELDPKNAVALYYYALFLTGFERFDEAESKFRRALELEPVSGIVNRNYGFFLMLARRNDESERQLRKTVEIDPNFQVAYLTLATTLQLQGKYAESVETYAKARDIAGKTDEAAMIRTSFRRGGWRGYVLDLSESDFNTDIRLKYIDATRLVSIGELQKALDMLEESYAARESFITLIKVDPRFDPLRGEARFQDLLRRVGLSQ